MQTEAHVSYEESVIGWTWGFGTQAGDRPYTLSLEKETARKRDDLSTCQPLTSSYILCLSLFTLHAPHWFNTCLSHSVPIYLTHFFSLPLSQIHKFTHISCTLYQNLNIPIICICINAIFTFGPNKEYTHRDVIMHLPSEFICQCQVR